MKRVLFIISAFLLTFGASAEEKAAEPRNNFKFYGFIRNYISYDSRESVAGTGDIFYYMPKDVALVNKGTADEFDKNAQSSARFLALTSRLGVDVSGYNVGNVHFGAKFEGDFYSGISKSSHADVGEYFPGNTNISGTASARLRQAYATVTWKDLPMGTNGKASVALKVGQAWHPMGADHPLIFSLENGAPFGPFSRTPLVQMDASLGSNWIVTGAAIWQMQYQSTGPVGNSAIYMKYGKTPEFYAAVSYKADGFLGRIGADLVSIKPRALGTNEAGNTVAVSDRKTSLLSYAYVQYTYKKFALKAKTVFGEGGEHMNLMSGYAKVGENADGSWEYASMRHSSTWFTMAYGKKVQGVLLLGYTKNFGLADAAEGPIAKGDVYFCSNGFSNLRQIYRINPQVIYTIGKLNLGLEYQFTNVQYGEYDNGNLNAYALADKNLHWVGNHRVNMMVKYNF